MATERLGRGSFGRDRFGICPRKQRLCLTDCGLMGHFRFGNSPTLMKKYLQCRKLALLFNGTDCEEETVGI
jgi:hypothetical protein